MSNEKVITLYDSASREGKPQAWNGFVWKTRYILNYKKIPYKTIWLEYPDIESTFRSIGAEPTSTKPDGSPFYTVPVISDPSRRTPDGGPTVISDTWLIAEYLDEVYPNPGPLFPEGTKALQKLFSDHIWTIALGPTVPWLVPGLHTFLNDESRPYWRRTREANFGKKLEEMCPYGTTKWEETWADVEKGFNEVAKLLDRNGKDVGPLVMVSHLTYVDLTMASILEPIILVAPKEWEDRVKHWDGGRWEKLRNMCADWRSLH